MAFQTTAFQDNAFQMEIGSPRDIKTYLRRYLNDLDSLDTSTHSVSFSVSVRDASFITYLRRYLNDT